MSLDWSKPIFGSLVDRTLLPVGGAGVARGVERFRSPAGVRCRVTAVEVDPSSVLSASLRGIGLTH